MRVFRERRVDHFAAVGEFHAKFNLERFGDGSPPRLPNEHLFSFRRKFLQEELDELVSAYEEGDLAKFADALTDLAYVVAGTAHVAGIDLDAHFAEVHRANMAKERPTGPDDPRLKGRAPGELGLRYDVVKPAGWVGPDNERIIGLVAADALYGRRP